jgi:hypothetical protein
MGPFTAPEGDKVYVVSDDGDLWVEETGEL